MATIPHDEGCTLRVDSPSDEGAFVVSDLQIMSAARNYRAYLAGLLGPYVHGDLLEVGAGIGNITCEVLGRYLPQVRSVHCVEAEDQCADLLRQNLSGYEVPSKVHVGLFPDTRPDVQFDCVYHLNVLEHIEDDMAALQACFDLLRPKGHLLIYVPAFQLLFGSMDRQLYHYRRYTRASIAQRLRSVGFTIVRNRYCNFLGFWAWFLNNRILKITSQSPKQVLVFDRYILPIQARLERVIPPLVGQNVFVVAQKP